MNSDLEDVQTERIQRTLSRPTERDFQEEGGLVVTVVDPYPSQPLTPPDTDKFTESY